MADRFQSGLSLFNSQGQGTAAAPAKYPDPPQPTSTPAEDASDGLPGDSAPVSVPEALATQPDSNGTHATDEAAQGDLAEVAKSAAPTAAIHSILGLTDPYAPSATEPFPALLGDAEPELNVPWGDFRQSAVSSVRALLTRARLAGANLGENFFKDSRIERRIPRQALVAAALWHIAFIVLPPIPGLSMTPRKNPSLDNFQLDLVRPD